MLLMYLSTLDSPQDQSWFTDLYNTHKKLMYYIAYNILGDEQMAENIVHDAFLAILEKKEKFFLNDRHKTKGLIDIIVRRQAINELTRRKRMEYREEFPDIPDPRQSVEQQVVSGDAHDRMVALIRGLDENYRSVLMLQYVYQYTPKETAEFLELSEATVRQRLHRAKQKLKKMLGEEVVKNE